MIKPEPAVFLHLLDKFALRAEESVFHRRRRRERRRGQKRGLPRHLGSGRAAQCRRDLERCGPHEAAPGPARHFPLNCGARLVRNASTPSAKSSVSASCRLQPSPPMQLLLQGARRLPIERLLDALVGCVGARRKALRDPVAWSIRAATSTHAQMRPQRSASAAESASPSMASPWRAPFPPFAGRKNVLPKSGISPSLGANSWQEGGGAGRQPRRDADDGRYTPARRHAGRHHQRTPRSYRRSPSG